MRRMILGSLLALGLAGSAFAEGVKIKGFTYGGRGCPGRSVGHQFSTDGTVLTLLFDKFKHEEYLQRWQLLIECVGCTETRRKQIQE